MRCKLRNKWFGVWRSPLYWCNPQQMRWRPLLIWSTGKDLNMVFLSLYVDDMIINESTSVTISEVKYHLFLQVWDERFVFSVHYFLGIEVASSPESCSACHTHGWWRGWYSNGITSDGVCIDDALNWELVGCMVYLSQWLVCILPVRLTILVSAPCSTHSAALLRILRNVTSLSYTVTLLSPRKAICMLSKAEMSRTVKVE